MVSAYLKEAHIVAKDESLTAPWKSSSSAGDRLRKG
jgi:hypothetical protein